jgi:hypothetical protein
MYDTKTITKARSDFRVFLFLMWRFLGLPDPTPVQYDIAHYLQHGPKRKCILAFRGVGKSWITSAYILWKLWNNRDWKNLVVSASKDRADAFSVFTKRLIMDWPLLSDMIPKDNQRDSVVSFDVGGAKPDQSPSVKSIGITGQLTGSRANTIVSDDVEVLNNSATADMRDKLKERIKEYSAIIKPDQDGVENSEIIYLGTPQTEDSIYNHLPETFDIRIWPARVPSEKEREYYGNRLAPMIVKMRNYGGTTDPQRFSDMDLLMRDAEYGKAGFTLQFMLNTQLSDHQRYPLKIRDLIVTDVAPFRAPMTIEWMPDYKKEMKHLPNLAMTGDRFFNCASTSEEFADYTGSVMSIDPSGRGKDETGYAVVKMLNGNLWVRRAGGLPGGYDPDTLKALAMIAAQEKVNYVVIEANFGDGMFTELFKPVLNKVHLCAIEEVKHSQQKERRIIETLEPLLNTHRLIFDQKVIEDDYDTANKYDGDSKFTKSLVYQMTRVCFDKGALKHDDRLDALAIACAYWKDAVAQDDEKGLGKLRERLLLKELQKGLTHMTGRPTPPAGPLGGVKTHRAGNLLRSGGARVLR